MTGMQPTANVVPGRCSVLCVTYNQEEFSAAALQSIYAQDYSDIEIIIVDDGSTDRNVMAIRTSLKSSPFPYKLIAQENTGNVPANFNRARQAASGEFLAMLSLDDAFEPKTISRKMRHMASDRNTMLCVSTLHHEMDDSGHLKATDVLEEIAKDQKLDPSDLLECEYRTIGSFFVQNAMFRTQLFDAVGGFDEDMTGDDIILRTKSYLYLIDHPEMNVKLDHYAGFRYRKHESNLHGNSIRQLKTVVEWCDRFFPDRSLPHLFHGWVDYHIIKCLRNGNFVAIADAEALNPEVAHLAEKFKASWKFKIARMGFGCVRWARRQ